MSRVLFDRVEVVVVSRPRILYVYQKSHGAGLVVEADALSTCHMYGAATDTVSFLATAVWLLPEAFSCDNWVLGNAVQ